MDHGDRPMALCVNRTGEAQIISLPAELLYYKNVFTLNFSSMTLSEGVLPLRLVLLVVLRVVLTLMLEGFVFYLLRFRDKRS